MAVSSVRVRLAPSNIVTNHISFLFPRERPPIAEAIESGANRAGKVRASQGEKV